MHHFLGTGLHCAPPTCVVHPRAALCTRSVGLCVSVHWVKRTFGCINLINAQEISLCTVFPASSVEFEANSTHPTPTNE